MAMLIKFSSQCQTILSNSSIDTTTFIINSWLDSTSTIGCQFFNPEFWLEKQFESWNYCITLQ